MTIRFSEEELEKLGFKRTENNTWARSVKASKKGRNTCKVSQYQRGSVAKSKRQNEKQEAIEERYRIVVVSYRKRHCDPDNLFPKTWIDELVCAGYLPDDSSKYVESVEKKVIKSKVEKTVIEIWKVITDSE